MKKFLISCVVLVVLVFGAIKIYSIINFGGATYYTRVTTGGQKFEQKLENGGEFSDYSYALTGYDEGGHARNLKFNANRSRPLKRNAYLKLVYNKQKGVTSWEAVTFSDVPPKALKKLR